MARGDGNKGVVRGRLGTRTRSNAMGLQRGSIKITTGGRGGQS